MAPRVRPWQGGKAEKKASIGMPESDKKSGVTKPPRPDPVMAILVQWVESSTLWRILQRQSALTGLESMGSFSLQRLGPVSSQGKVISESPAFWPSLDSFELGIPPGCFRGP